MYGAAEVFQHFIAAISKIYIKFYTHIHISVMPAFPSRVSVVSVFISVYIYPSSVSMLGWVGWVGSPCLGQWV
jgi:hypothetical protein